MNATTAAIVWMAVQVFLFTLAGSAVFLLLRRRGPSAAGACAAMVLAIAVPIVLVMVSPWPRWNIAREFSHAGAIADVKQKNLNGTPESSLAVNSGAPMDSGSMMGTISTWWQSAIDSLEPTVMPGVQTRMEPSWMGWIPWILAAGIGLGMARLAAGMWSVSRLRRTSKRIDDAELYGELWVLARQLRVPMVEMRESTVLRSAVTVGWRKPVVLLPVDWRSWTETERRVVLAHELAHIARGDFFTGIVARVAAVVHFYQPAVLWLGRQLRIQQELAADSAAAELAGSRQVYLATLAQMALRADEQPMPWGARAFLPGTSMLIKRVAWLKRGHGRGVEKSLGRSAKWLMAMTMAVIALGVAGIRGPERSSSQVAMAAEPEEKHLDALPKELHQIGGAKAGAESKWDVAPVLRTFKYVPADAKLVAGVSPSEIAKWGGVTPFVAMITKEVGFEKKFGMKLADVANVEFIRTRTARPERVIFDRLIVQTNGAHDWKKTITDLLEEPGHPKLEAQELAGKEIFVDPSGACFYMADEKTLIVSTKEEIEKIIQGNEKEMGAEEFPEFLTEPVALRAEMSLLKAMAGLEKLPQGFESNPVAAMFLPLIDHVQVECGYADAQAGSDKAGFHARLECDSADWAQQVAKTLEALRTVALNVLQAKFQAVKQSAPVSATAEQIGQINQFFEMVEKSLTEAKITATDKQVRVSADLNVNQAIVAGVVMPAVEAAREAARRTQSMNNMKQLGLAMHMYLTTNKHFPPAAIRDKDGKPLLSWRVTLLPYLEQKALYEQFHLDEPWDSEHNKPLIAKMPVVFLDPHDPVSTNASYFMPTGKGMFGGSENGLRIKDIMDGTSKTIAVVEAKRDIPWTKPEDIEIDADASKPLPDFGGHFVPDYFGATFADGSVRTLSKSIDPKILHAMFTVAGGEVITDEEMQIPAKAAPRIDSSGANSIKIEFHRAEDQPAAGLKEIDAPPGGPNVKLYLRPEAELSNADIQEATATMDDNGQPVIMVSFTVGGAEKMAKLTEENLGKPMVIMIDGKVISAPKIMSKISTKAQISGNFSKEEAERIARGINGK
jgi:beta-lactamase regulating signal transducer with metallopeptidase domain